MEVLAVESERLERIARAFSQFGRLPEGPRAPVDLGELVRYTARATVPAAGAVYCVTSAPPGVPCTIRLSATT